MYLVPFENYGKVKMLLEAFRENYDRKLGYGADRLCEEIISMGLGSEVSKKDLVVGRRYGVIEYSVGATAIRKGMEIPYHGEIYIHVYHWNGQEFVTENAWGVPSFRKTLCDPVVEIC